MRCFRSTVPDMTTKLPGNDFDSCDMINDMTTKVPGEDFDSCDIMRARTQPVPHSSRPGHGTARGFGHGDDTVV